MHNPTYLQKHARKRQAMKFLKNAQLLIKAGFIHKEMAGCIRFYLWDLWL